jgi:predicted dehydrogenase
MIDAFAAAGVPLFVAYYRRAMPRFLKVRDLLAAGVIGRLSGVAIRYAAPRHCGVDPEAPEWRLVPEVSGGGLFIDLGSHGLDLIDFLAGPLDAVSGDALRVASPVPVEDVVSLRFRAGGEVLGVGFWNFASDAREDVLEFTGTGGRISLSCYGEEPILVAAGGRIEEIPAPYPQHVQEPMIRTVVDALLGRGECASTGETAARTQRVMDRAIAGFYGRGS